MIAERLRKSILQAAIQGKLTEQLPEDGNSSDLLAKIQAEKTHLIKEGKIKKEKPLPKISEDEIPFDIPENWCWIRLSDYCEKVTDYVASGSFKSLRENAPFYKNPNYAILVKTADFANGFRRNLTYTDEKGYNFLQNSNLFGGELILSNIGASIGKVFIVPELGTKMTLAPNSIMLRFTDEEHLVKYMFYLMQSPYGYSLLMGITTGSATPKFNKTDLKKTIVPIPPLAEQIRICDCIEQIVNELDLLQKDETRLDTLQKSFPKKMKDSLLQSAIQGKLTNQLESDGDVRDLVAEIQKEKERLIKEKKIKKENDLPEITEDEIPFDIPDNWCWVRLGEVTDYGVGKQVNKSSIQPNSWVLELEDIEKESLALNIRRTDRIPGSSKNGFHKGDVLYGKLRPYLKKVIIADEDGCCSTEIIPFHGYCRIHSDYLKYCMVAPSVDSFINQITHGMDMPRLGTDKGRALVIPLPPLAEQHRIVERLDQLLPLCDTLE
jgi:type I restriction enzyme S subunit